MNIETAIVTGDKSFIGEHLVNALVSRGVKVIHASRERFQLSDWQSRMESADVVYNLAAAGSKKGNYSREEIFNTNLKQTWDLLEWSKNNAGMFVQVGTSSEYGKQETAMSENMKLKPDFLYAATKAAATQLVREHSVTHRKRAMVIRPFTIYGLGMQETKLIPTVIRNTREDLPIKLVEGEHDYLHVRDLVAGMIDLTTSDQVWEDGMFHEFNLGSGLDVTNEELVGLVASILNKRPIVERVSKLEGHLHHSLDSEVWRADISKASQYGWRPTISLYNGLTEIIYG